MPSTRISMCLICACEPGANVQPSNSHSAIRLEFIVPPSVSKVQPKLLCDSETDVTTDGHECCTGGMRNVPIRPEPDMHAWAYSHVGSNSGKQHVAAAPALVDSSDAI